MWQSPNQKNSNSANKSKRKKPRLVIHFNRIDSKVALIDDQNGQTHQIDVRFVLNDLNTNGAGFFSPLALNPGQKVKFFITNPVSIEINARIAWCEEFGANSHVISKQGLSFRIGAEFLEDENDKELIQKFFDRVRQLQTSTI